MSKVDKEVRDALIQKCKTLLNGKEETPLRMSEVHDLLLRNGIPFNILDRAYHVQTGQYMFYDRSVLLTQLLTMIVMSAKRADTRPEFRDPIFKHIQERIDMRCFRVNKETGHIDVYEYDSGVVLFERRVTND